MLCTSALFAVTFSTSPANRRFGYTDRRAGADQNHLPSSIRAIRTTSHAAGASSATCTSPSQERQLTCSCVAAGISTPSVPASLVCARHPGLAGALATIRSVASASAESGSLRPGSETGAPGARQTPEQLADRANCNRLPATADHCCFRPDRSVRLAAAFACRQQALVGLLVAFGARGIRCQGLAWTSGWRL